MYGPMTDDGFNLPAIPYQKMDPQFLRQIVPDPTGRARHRGRRYDGHHLYVVREGGRRSATASALAAQVSNGPAMPSSSGSSIGRNGRRRTRWSARDPKLRTVQRRQWRHAGRPHQSARRARASTVPRRRDTLYRLHGSPEWNSIGKSVSSGCVRLINQDVIDLYDRVPTRRR